MCVVVYVGVTSSMYLEKAQKLQNFAARVAVVGIGKYDHITPTFQQLQWIKIKDKCVYDVCIFVFNVLKKEYPSWLYTFPTVGYYRDASTRQNEDLYIGNYRTDLSSRSMIIRGPFCYNKLPSELKHCSTLNAFKKKLRNYFLNDG